MITNQSFVCQYFCAIQFRGHHSSSQKKLSPDIPLNIILRPQKKPSPDISLIIIPSHPISGSSHIISSSSPQKNRPPTFHSLSHQGSINFWICVNTHHSSAQTHHLKKTDLRHFTPSTTKDRSIFAYVSSLITPHLKLITSKKPTSDISLIVIPSH